MAETHVSQLQALIETSGASGRASQVMTLIETDHVMIHASTIESLVETALAQVRASTIESLVETALAQVRASAIECLVETTIAQVHASAISCLIETEYAPAAANPPRNPRSRTAPPPPRRTPPAPMRPTALSALNRADTAADGMPTLSALNRKESVVSGVPARPSPYSRSAADKPPAALVGSSILDELSARVARDLARDKLSDTFTARQLIVPAAIAGPGLARVNGAMAPTNSNEAAYTASTLPVSNTGRQALAIWQPSTAIGSVPTSNSSAASAPTGTSGTNADTVDGSHADAFAAAAHMHPGADVTSVVALATDADTVDGSHATDFATDDHTHVDFAVVDAPGLIVNEAGGSAATSDLRAESAGEANMLWLDASADLLYLGGTVGVRVTKGGGVRLPVATKAGDYTLTTADNVVVFTATATATLPAATGTGQTYRIICRAGTLTIDANASETIIGELTQVIYPGENLILSDVGNGVWE